jgi:hypothetical protein
MDPYVDEDPYTNDNYYHDDRYSHGRTEPWEFPLDPLGISLARMDIARRIGRGPVPPELQGTRSLWVAFTGEWGIWARAAIPLGDGSDPGDADRVARACTRAAELIGPPDWYEYDIAAVVLRRPGPLKPCPADRKIFRLIGKAAAVRETVPWSFYIAGPDGFYPLGTTAAR